MYYFFVSLFLSTDIFLPVPEGLLANLTSSKDLVEQLLERLPTYHQDDSGYRDDMSAMGAAMQAALKLLVRPVNCISVSKCRISTTRFNRRTY